jgi:hypothetical protein
MGRLRGALAGPPSGNRGREGADGMAFHGIVLSVLDCKPRLNQGKE